MDFGALTWNVYAFKLPNLRSKFENLRSFGCWVIVIWFVFFYRVFDLGCVYVGVVLIWWVLVHGVGMSISFSFQIVLRFDSSWFCFWVIVFLYNIDFSIGFSILDLFLWIWF